MPLANICGMQFHQDIKEVETGHEGKWITTMMVDYCLPLKRNESQRQ